MSPMALPRQAPIAIVGKKIPAGTYNTSKRCITRVYRNEPTIIPKLHAVKNTLVRAVRTKRNTLRHIAVGLEREGINK